MERADKGLAFILKYENVAWYEDGKVKILDRRIYPQKVEYVCCENHREVAQAIADMVTQSGGPYLAAPMGMALAAYEVRDKKEEEQIDYLKKAAYKLSHARPTTVKRMEIVVNKALNAAKKAIKAGQKADKAIFEHALEEINNKYKKIDRIAGNLVDFFPDKGTIITQCFAESIVGLMLREAKNRGKDIKVICPETRPYFQGARLTASVACEQGFDVRVITDNMPAYVMEKENVDLFTSAADVITMDGHVVNKIGTFQIAMAAHYNDIPYFVTGAPDRDHPDIDSIEIEERDGDFVLQAMGERTAVEGVKGYYPAFDITPPKFVSGVVTGKGIYSPYDLKKYYK
ncbi:methylthioribose-1-phosphate isomerase [Halanaerobium sp. DL-01]|uniref:S-methyl-5-thioribose-1-phosphate isomerase n=1 Tax=Halanaerobium sp. DL-01 TaxID=1653064 RepID=UPI000DF423B5|nr:S-methyl-5-thioribose-1-phosphate isomerase [Halanaerobium sp. DL-01]RCW82507.1 methylthioribose-1-phosphate isomerase [Halanaerobium sp. DL-01]